MDTLQKGIICLMKSAITEQKYELPEGFTLENSMSLIKSHVIGPLIYMGAIYCGISKKEPAMKQLLQNYCKMMMHNEKQMADVKKIFDAFEESGIDYMPVKGCSIKKLYPKPEFRGMGDADILIRIEQYEEIKAIMERLGFHFLEETDHDFGWKSEHLKVELHYLLTDIYNKAYKDYFGNGWKLAAAHEKHRYEMKSEDEFVYLFIHYTKHYRLGGIGCRHVIDLWVYLRRHPKMNIEYIENTIKKLSVFEFYQNTMKMISVWFEGGDPDEKTELMSAYIFESGSWGNLESFSMAKKVEELQKSNSHGKGELQVVRKILFPPIEVMRRRYTILKKKPYLLPGFWIWRWFDAMIFRRNKVIMYKNTIKNVCEKDATDFEKSLAYVGLDFKLMDKEGKKR